MTEKEKMNRQMLYDANNDEDLIDERKKAKDLECRKGRYCLWCAYGSSSHFTAGGN